jgi:hypothetical protein
MAVVSYVGRPRCPWRRRALSGPLGTQPLCVKSLGLHFSSPRVLESPGDYRVRISERSLACSSTSPLTRSTGQASESASLTTDRFLASHCEYPLGNCYHVAPRTTLGVHDSNSLRGQCHLLRREPSYGQFTLATIPLGDDDRGRGLITLLDQPTRIVPPSRGKPSDGQFTFATIPLGDDDSGRGLITLTC